MEFKPYSGNGKPFIYAIYAQEDKEAAGAVLSALWEKGYELWPSERFDKPRLRKAALVLFFLSPAAAASEAVNRAIQDVARRDGAMLAIHLSPTELTPTQKLLLNTQQAILKYDSTTEDAFTEKLFDAQPLQNLEVTRAQKCAARLTTWGSIAGVLCAVAVAIYLALGFNAQVPEDSLLSELGYQGRMADITSIYLYGDQISESRTDVSLVGVMYDWKNRTHPDGLYYNQIESFADFGNIVDLSDFAQLKNLEELSVAGNQVTDISGLYKLGNLEYLDLTGNPVQDISGIGELSKLQTLCIGDTKILDITPLDACANLSNVLVDEEQYLAFTKLETPHRYELVVTGPKEELDLLDVHIFGGPEEGGGDYTVFMQTRSWNVYDSFTYEFFKNDRKITITRTEKASSMEDGHLDKLHIFLNQAQFGSYDSNATYTLIVHFDGYSATYRVWHKFDPTRESTSKSELISVSGF
jgi:hypothetical protein